MVRPSSTYGTMCLRLMIGSITILENQNHHCARTILAAHSVDPYYFRASAKEVANQDITVATRRSSLSIMKDCVWFSLRRQRLIMCLRWRYDSLHPALC